MDGRNNGFSQSVLCKSGSYKAILSEHDARIFRDELEGFFVSQEKIRAHLASANEHLAGKRSRLESHAKRIEAVRSEMKKVYPLYQTDQVSPDGSGKLYRPLEEQEKALTAELPKLQAEVDALEIHQVSAEEVVAEATNLHRLWPTLASVDERRIIESITVNES